MTHPFDNSEISAEIAAIPMTDLHLHAEAGPRLHRILAKRRGDDLVDWKKWAQDLMRNVPAGMDRLNAMFFGLISPEEDAEPSNFVSRVQDVLEESARSGAIYVEVRFGRETIMRPDFMRLFRQAESEVASTYSGFMAEPLATLIPQRDSARTEVLVSRCILAATEGLAGVDLIPEPYISEADWTQTFRWAERMANAGLQLTVHAGEFSTANVAAALNVPGVRRIGHGIHAAADPVLLEKVAAANVALECCPTSNVILGAVDSLDALPLPALVQAGVSVTINTDNPVHFGTTITREYDLASRIGINKQDLLQATRNAIEFAFTTDQRKRHLRSRISAFDLEPKT